MNRIPKSAFLILDSLEESARSWMRKDAIFFVAETVLAIVWAWIAQSHWFLAIEKDSAVFLIGMLLWSVTCLVWTLCAKKTFGYLLHWRAELIHIRQMRNDFNYLNERLNELSDSQ